VHWILLGDGVHAEQGNDHSCTDICEFCTLRLSASMHVNKTESGNSAKKTAALANAEATRTAPVSTGDSTRSEIDGGPSPWPQCQFETAT